MANQNRPSTCSCILAALGCSLEIFQLKTLGRKISVGLSTSGGTRTNVFIQRWVIYSKHSGARIVSIVVLQCGS